MFSRLSLRSIDEASAAWWKKMISFSGEVFVKYLIPKTNDTRTAVWEVSLFFWLQCVKI